MAAIQVTPTQIQRDHCYIQASGFIEWGATTTNPVTAEIVPTGGGSPLRLEKIRGVKIDNTNSQSAVSVTHGAGLLSPTILTVAAGAVGQAPIYNGANTVYVQAASGTKSTDITFFGVTDELIVPYTWAAL